MPRYICSECGKIVIRNAKVMRFTERKSFCDSSGKHVVLIRLRIHKNRILPTA